MGFFTKEDMKSEINKILDQYPPYIETENEYQKAVRDFNHALLKDILKNPEKYDEKLAFMLSSDEFNFKKSINCEENIKHKKSWNLMFLAAYQIACAMDFLGHFYPGSLLEYPFGKLIREIESLPSNEKLPLVIIRYNIGYKLLRQTLSSDEGRAAFDFQKNVAEFEKQKENSLNAIKKLKEEVEEMEKNLNEQKNGHNFVEFNKGFAQLKDAKEKSKRDSLNLLVAISIFILIIPTFTACYLLITPNTTPISIDYAMRLSIPTFAIEIFAFYLFRITYTNLQSIKKQLLQIDLRMALIQFIQKYSDYAKSLKKEGDTSLDKFESLIFSSIIMDDQQLPSAFDGFEQISKLISTIKSRGS